MEPKTCEEYVLGELKEAKAKIDQLQDEKTRIMNELRSELIKVTGAKDYAAKIIDYLRGWVTLVPKEGSKDAYELRAMGHITLNLKDTEGLRQFLMLAPLFGEEKAQERLKQMAEATKEAAKKNTENKED